MTQRVHQAVAWSADRFFWSVMDAPGWKHDGAIPVALLAELGLDVPVAVESLHAVGATVGDGRLIVCAARREDLNGLLEEAPYALVPLELPGCLSALVDPRRLNLLIGPFEPRKSRLRRMRVHAAACAVFLLACGLACAGLMRRAVFWENESGRFTTASRAVAVSVLHKPDAEPEAVIAEAEFLGRSAKAAASQRDAFDAPAALASLLRTWPHPDTAEARPLGISVAGASMGLTVLVEHEPAEFLRSLTPPAGWVLEEPRLTSDHGSTRLSLELRRAKPAGGER